MPLLGLIAVFAGWFVRRILPWVVGLGAATAAATSDWARDFFFEIILIGFELFDYLFTQLFGKGELNLADRLADLPLETTYFLGMLRVLEAAVSIPEQKGSVRQSKTGQFLGSTRRALARMLPI